jgi:uncharacterized membrane protein
VRKWIPPALIAAAYAFSAAVYSRLPARVVTHWGPHGPNGWSPRTVAALLLPTLAVGIWLLMRWLPSIDPRGDNYARFRPTYDAVVAAIIALLVAIHVAILGFALGWPVHMEVLTPVAMGLLFIIIGNLLPRARPNWFFGIRTPWTLSSDRVWERTHRVGGYAMMVSGLVIIATAFVGSAIGITAIMGGVVVLMLGVVGYSYVLWRREQRGGA